MSEHIYKTSEAKRKANAKFDKANYRIITCRCKLDDADKFTQYAEELNLSVSKFVYYCITYCIDNKINLTDTQNKHTTFLAAYDGDDELIDNVSDEQLKEAVRLKNEIKNSKGK